MLRSRLCAGLLLSLALPAGAHPRVALDPTLPTDLTYAATDNVEYLGRFPEHSGTAGGRLLGDRFYLTDPRGVFVYDVSVPENPSLLGSLILPQTFTGVALAQEDPDTDGRILLVDSVDPNMPTLDNGLVLGGMLQVVDVSDPANMRVLGTADVADHTWNCVSAEVDGELNRCAYAYGRSGWIVDLRDPANPTPLDQTWRAAVNYGDLGNSPYTHDLTEIRPGIVLSAGSSNILMDTRDPARPVELNRVSFEPPRFSSLGFHQVEWPNGGRDPIAVFGTEIAPSGSTNTAGSDCEAAAEGGGNSVVETWDARAVSAALDAYLAGEINAEDVRALRFTRLDQFDAGSRGLFLDGAAPSHLLYCAHWFELHPAFDGAGRMAVSYYDRGTRFVDIAADGTMQEIGWIVAAESYSGSAQWISEDVVYIMDYRRGLEVVHLIDQPATGVYRRSAPAVPAVRGGALWLLPCAGLLLIMLGGRRRRRA